MIGHPETDHACSSTMHACGQVGQAIQLTFAVIDHFQPCDLRKAGTASHQEYTCSGTCAIPMSVPSLLLLHWHLCHSTAMIPTIAINVMNDNVRLLVNCADGYALHKTTSMGLKTTLYISVGKSYSPLPSPFHLIIDTVSHIPATLPVTRMESVRSKQPLIPSRRLSQARTKRSNIPRCVPHGSWHSSDALINLSSHSIHKVG